LKPTLGRWGSKRNESMAAGSSVVEDPTSQIRRGRARTHEIPIVMDDGSRLVIGQFSMMHWCFLTCCGARALHLGANTQAS
jgi:hypothetical protein